MKKGAVVRMPRAEQWAESICAELGKTVESIVEVGHLLLKAKRDLPHGEWGRIFEEGLIPFSMDKAQQLMAVASHPLLSNADHARFLPASWTTLYELTKLPEPTLKHALRDGLITPETERRQVKALQSPQPSQRPAPPDNPQDALDTIAKRLEHLWNEYPDNRSSILAAINSWDAFFASKQDIDDGE